MQRGVWAITAMMVATVSTAAIAAETGSAEARKILRQYCHRCHDGPGSASGYEFDILNPKSIADEGYLVPNEPDESGFFEKIIKAEMPPSGEPQPSIEEVRHVWDWIIEGAPEFPEIEARPFVETTDVMSAVDAYLKKADRRVRPRLRFFTLHNLHNNPAVSEKDLRLHRAALSKSLNGLHWSPRVVVPEAIDEHQTVFAIDLLDFESSPTQAGRDWFTVNMWNEIIKRYPYGISFKNVPNDPRRDLENDITQATGTTIPIIRVDWFVTNATRPPLYHDILNIPEDAGELERILGVNIARGFENPIPQRIARGGFPKSGVSGQNRLVERNEARFGAYWKSYDFKAGSPKSKLTRFPLGPLNLFSSGNHPFPNQAFIHDGGEMIFNLPNGLQAYMLIDGENNRINEGPVDVVNDALETSGTPAIVNGLSCMACHKNGMIPFTDKIRDGSAVFGSAQLHLQELYPEKEVMDRLVDGDRQRFLRSLEKAVKPFLMVEADVNTPIEEFIEPVGELARFHQLSFLNLETIAIELGFDNPQALVAAVGQRRFKELGLESLLNKGVISRQEWEAVSGISLMQELSRELQRTPLRVL